MLEPEPEPEPKILDAGVGVGALNLSTGSTALVATIPNTVDLM